MNGAIDGECFGERCYERACILLEFVYVCCQRWIFLRIGFARYACADERIDIAWWSPSPGIVWHCEVRDGLLVMKMSSMLFCLVGVVIICSVWVVRSMSKKRLFMSTGYECPCMVQSGQLMSGRLRSPPTQSTEFLCLDVRSSMVLHMSSIYCRSLFVSLRNRHRLVEMGGWAGGRHNLYSSYQVQGAIARE